MVEATNSSRLHRNGQKALDACNNTHTHNIRLYSIKNFTAISLQPCSLMHARSVCVTHTTHSRGHSRASLQALRKAARCKMSIRGPDPRMKRQVLNLTCCTGYKKKTRTSSQRPSTPPSLGKEVLQSAEDSHGFPTLPLVNASMPAPCRLPQDFLVPIARYFSTRVLTQAEDSHGIPHFAAC